MTSSKYYCTSKNISFYARKSVGSSSTTVRTLPVPWESSWPRDAVRRAFPKRWPFAGDGHHPTPGVVGCWRRAHKRGNSLHRQRNGHGTLLSKRPSATVCYSPTASVMELASWIQQCPILSKCLQSGCASFQYRVTASHWTYSGLDPCPGPRSIVQTWPCDVR